MEFCSMIIDFHTHYQISPDHDIIREMDKTGIEKSLVLAVPDHKIYAGINIDGTNEKCFEYVSKHSDRLIMAAYIEPRNVMEAQTQIERFYDHGIRYFKMWPGHGYSPDDPAIFPVWEKLNEIKAQVIFHTGMLGTCRKCSPEVNRLAGFNAKYGQPILFDVPARLFRDVTIIMAHAAYPWTLEVLEMARMFDNVYFDLSCPLGFNAWNLIDKLRPLGIPWNKMLFGTDSGGDSETAESTVKRWKELLKEDFCSPYAEDIFSGNALTLLKKAGLM